MRSRALWLAAAVLAGACSSAAPGREAAPAPEAGWPAVVGTLTDRFDAASPNVCTRGAPECLDVLIGEMTARLDRLVATCDHNAPFALAYLATTRGLHEALRTVDPAIAAYMRHLDAVYVRTYFDASDAWAAGRRAAVPPSWGRAFDAAARRQVTALGDLLTGMNAHITRDLALALAAVGLTLADGRSAKPAFDIVNAVLAGVQQPMLAELARRLDPTVAQVDLSRIAPAAASVGILLTSWRDEAWVTATRLVAASGTERRGLEAALEAHADSRGLSIVLGTSYVPFLSSTAPRDQFCAVNGRR